LAEQVAYMGKNKYKTKAMTCDRLRDVPINVRKTAKYCPYRNFGDICCLLVRESTTSFIKTED